LEKSAESISIEATTRKSQAILWQSEPATNNRLLRDIGNVQLSAE